VRALAALPVQVGLELGPSPTLTAFAQGTLQDPAAKDSAGNAGDEQAIAWAASLRKGRSDHEQIHEALATLYLAGVAIDWRAVWSAAPAPRVDLPAYAFQREPLWFSARPQGGAAADARAHPLLGTRQRSAQRELVTFESVLRAGDLPFVDDHRVLGEAILPATGYLEMALVAGAQVLGAAVDIADVAILEPMRFAGEQSRIVQVLVRPKGAEAASFEILSAEADADANAALERLTWTRHAEGRVLVAEAAHPRTPVEAPEAVRARCTGLIEAPEHRAQLASRGLVFGPALHGVKRIHRGSAEAIGEIELPPPAVAGRGAYHCHPAWLDACVQVLSAALVGPDGHDLAGGAAWLPLAIGRLRVFRPDGHQVPGPIHAGRRAWSHARVEMPAAASSWSSASAATRLLKGEIAVHDADGPVLVLSDIALRPARAAQPARGDESPFFRLAWLPRDEGNAAWLPSPAALDACAGPHLAQLVRSHGLESYQQAFVALEALSAGWIGAALAQLGLAAREGEFIARAGLATRLRVLPLYERLLWRLLDVLAEDGHLEASTSPSGWRVIQAWPVADAAALDAQAHSLLARHTDSTARLRLASNCGPHLAGILRGQVDPLGCLFPNGSTALAEALYRDAPEARAFNQLLREAVRAVIAAKPAGRTLRVLEVGGGTGGTTAWIAPECPAEATEYVFTDIGPSMVARAKEKFAAHRFMDFQTLDLERAPQEQALAGRRFDLRNFDLIVAANVVHATADLQRTLARLRALLAPGGTLLMLEVAGFERWIDITFGLTEGWWRFSDHGLRADYPLLGRPAWLDLLRRMGFEAAAVGAVDERSREVLLAARRPVEATLPAPLIELDESALGHWILIGDGQDTTAPLAAALRTAGATVTLLDGASHALTDPAPLRSALDAAQRSAGAVPLRGIVHLAAMDLPALTGAGPWREAQRPALEPMLALMRGLGGLSFAAGRQPRLWCVTRGAVAASGVPTPLALPQATLWGLMRSLRLEHPELQASSIDLDPETTAAAQAEALAQLLIEGGRDNELAHRGGQWHAARLVSAAIEDSEGAEVNNLPPEPSGLRLVNGRRGVIDDLALEPFTRRPPGPGEVEIRVVAGGLNFRDVMNALAMRADPEPLGGECSGRIVAVGAGVERFKPGDAVVAIAEASFATHALTPAALVRPLPVGIGFAEGATLPFAFMTAWHALVELGGLERGHTVLVHAAAGGVGMAALQIALAAGARVFATAGSPAKRELVRARGAAVVLDSRSLRFADEVLAHTGGRGVDLVLNSLAGEFIDASVRCLAADGVFLEIGKRDIWSAAQFAGERPAGRYHAIDLAAMRYQEPAACAALFDRVLAEVQGGRLKPLPLQTFALTQAAEGFRCMAQAKHVGKVVLVDHTAHPTSLATLDPQASYLITGGLSGLGLLTAESLVAHGARHLLLVGRREPQAEAQERLAGLREAGATVHTHQLDAGDPAAVRALVHNVNAAHPLRGVIHSAGALEDGALLQQDWARFVRPLAAKLDGAFALHEATRGLPLDFFVLYSSIAGTLGSAGQANHAAANSFMDALAAHRRALGLPALSIAWGAWSETGAAAERGVDERVASLGLKPIAPAAGLAWLESLMAGHECAVVASPLDFDVLLDGPRGTLPIFDGFRRRVRSSAAGAAGQDRLPGAGAQALTPASSTLMAELAAASPARRLDLLLGFVADQVARVIGSSRETIDPRQPLQELGLDSLMAVELRNRLAGGLELAQGLPATLVFDHPTLEALAKVLAREVPGGAEAAPTTASATATAAAANQPAAAATADAAGAIDDLSDEEVERLFAQKLGRR
jgi:NADPH:quinone reductase-like Zn-dependent oxidoreductase/NAD(P)-dependent dehydrogenase (short-subunit alcohol dehydrogenase family)/SAM-dependent methyltransferase/aryl carrier-like protein